MKGQATQPPDVLYLQWHGDGEPSDSVPTGDDVTWCRDKVFDHDVKYVRNAALESSHAELVEAVKALDEAPNPCGREHPVIHVDRVLNMAVSALFNEGHNSLAHEVKSILDTQRAALAALKEER